MKVALFGATGFVGSYILDCLIEEGVVIMPGSIIRSGAIIKKHSIIRRIYSILYAYLI